MMGSRTDKNVHSPSAICRTFSYPSFRRTPRISEHVGNICPLARLNSDKAVMNSTSSIVYSRSLVAGFIRRFSFFFNAIFDCLFRLSNSSTVVIPCLPKGSSASGSMVFRGLPRPVDRFDESNEDILFFVFLGITAPLPGGIKHGGWFVFPNRHFRQTLLPVTKNRVFWRTFRVVGKRQL